MPRRRRTLLFHTTLALALTAAVAVGFWFVVSHRWLLAWLVAVNLIVFLYYGVDKFQAIRQGRRIPELTLHGLALLGGSPGAYVAMQLFRHKTIKGRFRIVFWLIVLLQGALLGWLAYRGLAETFHNL